MLAQLFKFLVHCRYRKKMINRFTRPNLQKHTFYIATLLL